MTSAEKFLMEIGNVDDEFIEEAMNFTMKKKFNWKPIIAVAACAAFALAAIPVAKHFANNELINTGTTSGTAGTAGTESTASTAGTNGTSASTGTPIVPENNFRVLFAGNSDKSIIDAEQKIETDFDGLSVNFTDKTKNGTTKTVEIAGETYTGVYVNSTKSDYYKDDTDNYFVEVDNKKVTFSINTETGVCTNFYVADENPEIGKVITRDECYAKAVEHLKIYIEDIEMYELGEEYYRGGKLGYLFCLYRMVNGIKTSDCIYIRVKETGKVFSHTLYNIGQMKNTDFSKMKINMYDINNAISKKVDTIYAKYSDINHNIDNILLAKTVNGKYVFVYDVSLNINKDGKNFNDMCRFVVEIE